MVSNIASAVAELFGNLHPRGGVNLLLVDSQYKPPWSTRRRRLEAGELQVALLRIGMAKPMGL